MECENDEDIECMDEDEVSESEQSENKDTSSTYLPGQPLEEGEQLVFEKSAYKLYHQAQTGAPCLSFDVLRDNLGDGREEFPLTCYMVCGTQAARSHVNSVIVLKMSGLHAIKDKDEDKDDDNEESASEDENDEEAPELESAMIKHNGGVNRIRATVVGDRQLAATWSETGKVHIWDLTRPLNAVNDSNIMASYTRNEESPPPIYTFPGHQVEGFALDWCQTTPGWLATGDCSKNIHVWKLRDDGTWHVDQRPYKGHTASIEDIQWSPNETNVFASCSVDKSIRIWDVRAPNSASMLTAEEAHDRDINVITWNKSEPFIISGGDDGLIKVWDLRKFKTGKPAAYFKHHTSPITSVEWHPTDSSVFAASGSDDQITLWDLAVERDSEGSNTEEPDVPPQLLFIHQGQTDIKELHWHPQLTGVVISTAHSGFNVFRTISV